MSHLYNDFIDSLASGRSPDPDRVSEVCAELGKDLRRELNRRGLWTSSPKLVGIEDRAWSDDALVELVLAAYEHSFLRRLRGLKNHRRHRDRKGKKKDAAGLIRRNLRNFLTDRQKQHDPIGYFLFENSCKAVRQAIAAGDVAILNAPPPETERGDVDGATLLGFGSGLAPVTDREQLDEIVPEWSDVLFPGLITARTNALKRELDKLALCLADLSDAGVEAFRLGDLVGALKHEMRRRWQQRMAEDLGEAGREDLDPDSEPTAIVRPEDEVDGEQRLAWIVRCVSQRIVALAPGAARDLLFWKVWPFVRSCQANDAPRPPWTVISRELDIPRKRVKRLYDRLGEMTVRCRELLGRPSKAAGEQRIDSEDPESRSEDRPGERIAAGASTRGR